MPRYGGVAMLLHWLIAACVLALAGLGLVMVRGGLQLQTKIALYQLHKSLGATVLALMLLRILWRLTHRPPPLPTSMPAWERAAAHTTHAVLYLLLVLVPISGWVMVSGSPIPVPTRLFWTVTVPHLEPFASWPAEIRRAWSPALKQVHLVMAVTLLALIVLHVLAALRHHFVLKDDILRRMLPSRQRSGAIVIAGLATMLAAAPEARAQEAPTWKVDAAKSSIGFEATAAGQKFPGAFKSFTAEIRFDPAAPEKTRITATIKSKSVSTGTSEIDDALSGKEWFDAKQFPDAIFKSERAEKTADGAYRLSGTLTLKGRPQPSSVPFKLTVTDGRARAEGEAVVDRLAFGIGPEGPIEGTVVAREVRMRIIIEAERE